MRINNISSSIASVVARVIVSVVIAGNAARRFLHLTQREHRGYWLELQWLAAIKRATAACLGGTAANDPMADLFADPRLAPAFCMTPTGTPSAGRTHHG